MLIDLYTKGVLTIIAIALTIIAVNPWVGPTEVEAQGIYDVDGTRVGWAVQTMQKDLDKISRGVCDNSKIC